MFRYGYTARELDAESGLQYNRARYLDSFTGRFISEDPISFAGGDTNLYRYVFNSPNNASDPSGLITFIIPGSPPNNVAEYDRRLVKLENNIQRYARYSVVTLGRVPVGSKNQNFLDGLLGDILGACNFAGLFPVEPINIVAHSNGNLYVQGVIDGIRNFNEIYNRTKPRMILDPCLCGNEFIINVLRLDPVFVAKPRRADFVLDVGSNNPGSVNPTDIFALVNLKPDLRAKLGTSHNGLLEDESIIRDVSRYFRF